MSDGSVTIEVELTKEQLEKGLKSIQTDLKKLEKPSTSIAKKISSGFENVGKVATKAGTALTVGLTTPLIALGTAGVKYNAQMEDFEANLTTLLGSADKAKDMLADLKEMANTTPFETTDLLDATQTMLGFGLEANKTKGYLQMLGDVSMGNAEKLKSLTLAFSQIGASGKATMEDINQMIDAGFNPLFEISQKTGKSIGELREEVSAGKISFEDIAGAMEIATSEGGRFYKSMENAAGTMNGKLSSAMDALNTALGNLTESLLPIVTKVVEKITELANIFANLDQGTQETILTIAGIVVAAGPILGIVGNISKGISGIIGLIPNLSKGIGTASKAFKSFNAVLKANPILLVVSVIGSLIAILVNLYQTNEDFRNAITETWNSICSFFSSIPSFFQEMWENIKNFFINGWNSIVSFFTETIPQWIQNIITWFQELPYNLGVIAGEMFGHIVNFGVNAWNWVTTELPKIIQDIIKWFAELPGNIWNWLVSVIDKIIEWGQNTWNTATKWVSDTITAVIDWFKKLPSNIWSWLNETINKVINWGKDLINKGTEAAKGLFENIVNTIQELPSKMWDIGKNIVEGIWNGITGMGSWLKDKIFGFAGGFVDGVKNAFGIHSPSKLLEDEVGEYLPLGIWKGFYNNLKKVYSKMQNAINFETQKLSASLTSNKIINAQVEDNRQATLQSIDDNKEIVVNTTTKLDSKIIARETNKVNARQKLQYGLA